MTLLAEKLTIIFPLMGYTCMLFTLANYYMAAFTEPGFLPRGEPCETRQMEEKDKITYDVSGEYFPEPKGKIVQINKIDYELKFCVSKIKIVLFSVGKKEC